ncbi:hypothetical protein CEXT_445671 [Caerostris extrusa]|uniref:Uncharacterized protein n=1 Tax=Caerostris extrusa TaxID=172846 RepID=A0AAV4T000_CAEEX|nr:hypothetical protein CEXT_445671 [Caerostris extrusa]
MDTARTWRQRNLQSSHFFPNGILESNRPLVSLKIFETNTYKIKHLASKFRGNVSNNAKRSQIGSWSLLLRFDGYINHSVIALGDIGEESKIKSCGFVAFDLLSGCAWTFWTPPLIIAVAFQPLLLIMKDFGSRFNFKLCGYRAYT